MNQEELEEAVYNAKCNEAAEINNDSRWAQIVYLQRSEERSSNDYEKPAHPILLTPNDWTEIYYALEIRAGNSSVIGGDLEWIEQLDNIVTSIGPDGETASSSGVAANG